MLLFLGEGGINLGADGVLSHKLVLEVANVGVEVRADEADDAAKDEPTMAVLARDVGVGEKSVDGRGLVLCGEVQGRGPGVGKIAGDGEFLTHDVGIVLGLEQLGEVNLLDSGSLGEGSENKLGVLLGSRSGLTEQKGVDKLDVGIQHDGSTLDGGGQMEVLASDSLDTCDVAVLDELGKDETGLGSECSCAGGSLGIITTLVLGSTLGEVGEECTVVTLDVGVVVEGLLGVGHEGDVGVDKGLRTVRLACHTAKQQACHVGVGGVLSGLEGAMGVGVDRAPVDTGAAEDDVSHELLSAKGRIGLGGLHEGEGVLRGDGLKLVLADTVGEGGGKGDGVVVPVGGGSHGICHKSRLEGCAGTGGNCSGHWCV